jgi:hypothetical protein
MAFRPTTKRRKKKTGLSMVPGAGEISSNPSRGAIELAYGQELL